MRNIAIFCLLAYFMVVTPQHAKAQTFTTFECTPFSCVDSVGPTFSGVAVVLNDFQCTSGVGHSLQITAAIGQASTCSSLYSATVNATKLRDTQLDDCGNPFFLDTSQLNGTVKNIFGTPVFDEVAEFGCDGGESSVTDGQIPC